MEYRYERKIFIENISRKAVESYIKIHPAMFKEIYHKRYINNIYFDYPNFNNFHDNIIGSVNRTKYRIRWYGDLFCTTEQPQLELKIKKGLVGTKKIFPLTPFSFRKKITAKEIKNVILDNEIDPLIKIEADMQLPVIVNRYKRTYFESLDKKFRITIDDSQEFYKVNPLENNFMNKIIDDTSIIVELKYDAKDDIEAKQMLKQFPFRISKSSKYARAIELFYV